MTDLAPTNPCPQSSDAGERIRIGPDVLTKAVDERTDLLFEDIGSLAPEAQSLALRRLQARAEASLAALGSHPQKMEVGTEVLKDRETYTKLVGEYRRIAPDGNLDWNQILQQPDGKVLDTWRTVVALADFILGHPEMLSENLKADFSKEFRELVSKNSEYANWAKHRGDHSELPNNAHEWNVRSQAVGICRLAADPLNFPEEEKSAPHVKEAIDRLCRETRPDVKTVKVLSAEKIIEERAGIQRAIDDEVSRLNALLAKYTHRIDPATGFTLGDQVNSLHFKRNLTLLF